MKYIIEDWAGNKIFGEQLFDTFEDAWAYVYEHIEDEESYQDIYVEEYKERE